MYMYEKKCFVQVVDPASPEEAPKIVEIPVEYLVVRFNKDQARPLEVEEGITEEFKEFITGLREYAQELGIIITDDTILSAQLANSSSSNIFNSFEGTVMQTPVDLVISMVSAEEANKIVPGMLEEDYVDVFVNGESVANWNPQG